MVESRRWFEVRQRLALGLLALGLGAGCATARPAMAPEPAPPATSAPAAPPRPEVVVMARGDEAAWRTQWKGRWAARLPDDAPGLLRDAVAAEARRLGVDGVRTAAAPARPEPRQTPRAESTGSVWGDLVPAAPASTPTRRSAPAGAAADPAPAPGATWLEVTSVALDLAVLSSDTADAALMLTVEAQLTSRPGEGPATASALHVTLIDPELRPTHGWGIDGWGEADGARAQAVAARLVERAGRRLAEALRPDLATTTAPATEQLDAVAPGASSAASATAAPGTASEPGAAVAAAAQAGPPPAAVPDVSAAYLAREWTGTRVEPDTGRGALSGAGKGLVTGGQVGGYAGMVCGPFAFFCALVLAPVGAVAGGLIGAVGGASDPPARLVPVPARAELPDARLRAELGEALLRLGRDPALAAAVQRSARAALAEAAPQGGPPPTVRITRLAVTLTADGGPAHPARLTLAVTGAVGADPSPAPLAVEVVTPDALPAQAWAEDGGALLAAVLASSADQAGRRLAGLAPRGAPAP